MKMGRKFWFAVVVAVCATGLAAVKVLDAETWLGLMYMLIPAFVTGNVLEHATAMKKPPTVSETTP